MKPWLVMILVLVIGLALAIPQLAMGPAPAPIAPAVRAPIRVGALNVTKLCGAEGALGKEFGITGLSPSPYTSPGFDKRPAPAEAAPFTLVALDATRWSNHFYRATYLVPVKNRAEAQPLIDAAAAQFRTLGWIEKTAADAEADDSEDFSLVYPSPAKGEVHFYSETGGISGEARKGVLAAIGIDEGHLRLECTNLPLLAAQQREAMGEIPAGTPMPRKPIMPRPEMLDVKVCATAEGRARVDQVIGGEPDAMTRYVAARSGYRERIVTWKADRLRKSGKVADERLMELTLGGLFKGFPGGNPLVLVRQLGDIVSGAIAVEQMRRMGSYDAACQRTVGLMQKLASIERSTSKQWDSIETALDAEAKAAGVSWDGGWEKVGAGTTRNEIVVAASFRT